MKKIIAGIALVVFGLIGGTGTAYADELCQTKPEQTKIVKHDAKTHEESRWQQEVPAVQEVSHQEYQFSRVEPKVDAKTHLEYRFSRTNPGSEAVTHDEFQFSRVEPAKDAVTHPEWRMVITNPGKEAVKHTEYQFNRTNPGHEETFTTKFKYEKTVQDFKTQYHFRKYVQTRTREWVDKVDGKCYVWKPNHDEASQDWHPKFSDADKPYGSWSDPKKNCAHMDEYADGTVYNVSNGGNGNGSYFYVESHEIAGHWTNWSDFGPWTPWEPIAHESWQDSNDPLGSPEFHAQGGNKQSGEWYRQWQARWDGTTREVPNGTHTEKYNDGAWTTEILGDPWVKVGEHEFSNGDHVAPFTEYKTAGDPSKDIADAKWFTDSAFDGWTQFNTRSVIDEEAVAPFDEWATKDGRTTDVTKAAYFTEAEIATFSRGWSKYGDAKIVTDEEAIPAKTFYKTVGGESEDIADAAWFLESSFDGWTQFNKRTVTDKEAVAPFTEYRTADGSASINEADAAWFTEPAFEGWTPFGEPKLVEDSPAIPEKTFYKTNGADSLNAEDAAWFKEDSFEGWTQFNSKKVVDSEFVAGYTIYYVHGGEPTLTLGDSNWTTDKPEGWTFVDKRTVEDKAAWSEKVTIKAVYEPCALAFTGTDPIVPAGIGLGIVAVGSMVILALRRKTA